MVFFLMGEENATLWLNRFSDSIHISHKISHNVICLDWLGVAILANCTLFIKPKLHQVIAQSRSEHFLSFLSMVAWQVMSSPEEIQLKIFCSFVLLFGGKVELNTEWIHFAPQNGFRNHFLFVFSIFVFKSRLFKRTHSSNEV